MDSDSDHSERESGERDTEAENDKRKKEREKKPESKPNSHVEINGFHRLMGHASEESMRRTAKHHDVRLTGKFEACEDCLKSNAMQRSVKKTTEGKSAKFGERLCVDSSSAADHLSLRTSAPQSACGSDKLNK